MDYDPNELYQLLERKQQDLAEAEATIEKALAMFKISKQGNVPINLEELLQFVLRLYGDINVLYLADMALISQFRSGEFGTDAPYGK